MAFAFPSAAPQSISYCNDHDFFSAVNRLKNQNALSQNYFQEEIPFFNIASLPKEMQIRELFENSCDTQLCAHLLKNVAPLSEGAEQNLVPQNYSSTSVMSFAQIVLYKVLPCPYSNCADCPREIATHNQYKDFEYECPFYHHEKDRRRLVFLENAEEEFTYKANYFEEGKRKGDTKEKYSQNYFESMFHPLYYKMFRCKRDFCQKSAFCPFFHCEEEKNVWDNTFISFYRKERGTYVKDKPQRGTQKRPQRGQEAAGRKLSSEETNPSPLFYSENQFYSEKRFNLKQYKLYQQQKRQEEVRNYLNGVVKKPLAYRKNSDSSSEENQNNHGFFSKLQASAMRFNIY